MKVSIVHADTCLSDYWPGHHRPHVQIPCTRPRMSLAEVRQLIRSEIAQGAVAGNDDDTALLSWDFVRDEKRADILTRKVYAAINRDIRGAKKGQRFVDGGDDGVYMFFVIVVEE